MHVLSAGKEHDNQPDKRLLDRCAAPCYLAYETGAKCDDIGLEVADGWSEKLDNRGYSLSYVLRARAKIRCGVCSENCYNIVGVVAFNCPFPQGIRTKQTNRKQQNVRVWCEFFI